MLFGIKNYTSGKTPGTIDVLTRCPGCTSETPLTFESQAWYNLMTRGDFIQDALKDYHANVREMLQTGYCPPCWDAMMADTDKEY